MKGTIMIVGLVACGAPASSGDDDVQSSPDASRADARPGSVTIGSYDETVMNMSLRGASFNAELYTAQPDWPHAPDTGCALVVFPPSAVFPPKASAGVIKFGTSPAIQIVPDSAAAYATVTTDKVPPANQEISVSASGDAVPAFTGSVTMPSRAVLAGPITTVDRGHDLVVHWTGGSGMFRFEVGDTSTTMSKRVMCAFPAAGASGTVPSGLLGQLPSGQGVVGASVTVRTDVDAGAWTIAIVAATSVVWPDLSPAGAIVTLQ